MSARASGVLGLNVPCSSLLDFEEPQTAAKGASLFFPDPAPPRSLFAVNKTQTSVTLLWVEEGVADFFEVFCQQASLEQDRKNQVSVSSILIISIC